MTHLKLPSFYLASTSLRRCCSQSPEEKEDLRIGIVLNNRRKEILGEKREKIEKNWGNNMKMRRGRSQSQEEKENLGMRTVVNLRKMCGSFSLLGFS